jgi:oligoribonuclease
MKNEEVAFVFIDLETTGLDDTTDDILEYGIILTDIRLNEIAIANGLLAPPDWRVKLARNAVAWEMHQKSGLYSELNHVPTSAFAYDYAAKNIKDFLLDFIEPGVLAMAGSSVDFDRGFILTKMPSVAEVFHYRREDVSSLKQFCRKFNPALFARLQETAVSKEDAVHRSIPDLRATIAELKSYAQEFLLTDILFD